MATAFLAERYARKYNVLSEKCREIEHENKIVGYKLREIRRVVSKIRKEKRLLMKRLDKRGDEYRSKPSHIQRDVIPAVPYPGIAPPVVPDSGIHPAIRVIPPDELHSFTHFIPIQTPVTETSVKGKSPQRKGKGVSKKSEKASATTADRKKQKIEDSNIPPVPRKPANAFLIFCQQNRESTQEQCGVQLQQQGQAHHELTRMLAKKWNEMASPDKKIFYELYEQEKLRYAREMEVFQAAGGVLPTKSSPGRGTKKQGKASKRKKGQTLATETNGMSNSELESTGSIASTRIFPSPFYEGVGLDDDDDSFGFSGEIDVKSALAVSPKSLPRFPNRETPSQFSESPAPSSSNGEEEQDDVLY
ncbi:uncharacterized protein LOC134183868 [Corticium candelabrum]|uniref:uncharacterized protein LOC134183868 n=1 Tax=Corticium candelabrum TaxID=121492 RepID=UPI002E347E95|nr:uncharacterized protein LOC134183868 [Corticium candelabrum]